MSTLTRHLRFALRMLLRQPGFAVVAILTLALGIGATTAIFSAVHGVAFKPIALPDGERLQRIGWSHRGWLGGMDDAQFRHFREHQRAFSDLVAATGASFTLVADEGGQRVSGLHVSSGYFETVGVMPRLGRPFVEADDQVGAAPVVILAHALWRDRFGADPDLIGRDIRLDGAPYRVVGVMPVGFDDYSGAALWTPLAAVAGSIGQGTNYSVLGRLRVERHRADAEAELLTLARGWRASRGQDWPAGLGFAVTPLGDALAQPVRGPLLLLLGAIGFVLLIACANVANLMLTRAQVRRREMAVRAAVGASRRQLAAQVLVEGMLLAVLGGLLALPIAASGVEALLSLAGDGLPRAGDVRLDGIAFAFALLLALGGGTLAALPSAWQAGRRELVAPLKQGEPAAARTRRLPLPPLRTLLVSGQVALALVLLVGAGLLLQSLAHLGRVDPGFAPERALAAQFWTSGTRHRDAAAVAALHRSLAERAAALPGIEAAGVVVAGLPLERGGNLGAHWPGRSENEAFSVDYRSVSPGYLDALGVGLRQGRTLDDGDSATSTPVVLVNEAFVRAHLPEGTTALGRRLHIADATREIVGVVADLRSALDQAAPPTVFLPVAQSPLAIMHLFEGWFPSHLVARGTLDPVALTQTLREAMLEVDPLLPLGSVRPMTEVFAAALATQRFQASLMGAFAALALLLAALGVYGVLSYRVGRRVREIGIQVALGAGRADVLRQVLGQGLRPVLAGLAFGLLGAWSLAGLLGSMLHEIEPLDAGTYAAVVLLLSAVAILACLLPALRALRVDPLEALRHS